MNVKKLACNAPILLLYHLQNVDRGKKECMKENCNISLQPPHYYNISMEQHLDILSLYSLEDLLQQQKQQNSEITS